MNLFMKGDFTLRSGRKSTYKIECDVLTVADWEGIAAAIMEEKLLPNFSVVLGVPRGGLPLADALNQYATSESTLPIIIAEDIVTTCGSMERFRSSIMDQCFGREIIGVCFVARGPCPSWVHPYLRGPGV